jgi:hypothetical protein
MALVNAAKDMVIANMATQTPLRALLAEAPEARRGGLMGECATDDMVPFRSLMDVMRSHLKNPNEIIR